MRAGWLAQSGHLQTHDSAQSQAGRLSHRTGGKHLGEGIVCIAQVTGTAGSEYYQDRRFARRPDCIYHFRDGGLTRKKTAACRENPANMATDPGAEPEYRNARVLLNLDFRCNGYRRAALEAGRDGLLQPG